MLHRSKQLAEATLDTAVERPHPSEWVERYGDYLFRYARRYFDNPDTAEEVVQETLLAALEGYERFEAKASFKTWLTSILRHKVLDTIRRKGKTTPIDPSSIAEQETNALFDAAGYFAGWDTMQPWDIDPETVARQREFLEALADCVDKLPEQFRRVFYLRGVEDFGRKEISNKLGLTTTNVGVILHRARLLLRQCLQTNWIDETGSEA